MTNASDITASKGATSARARAELARTREPGAQEEREAAAGGGPWSFPSLMALAKVKALAGGMPTAAVSRGTRPGKGAGLTTMDAAWSPAERARTELLSGQRQGPSAAAEEKARASASPSEHREWGRTRGSSQGTMESGRSVQPFNIAPKSARASGSEITKPPTSDSGFANHAKVGKGVENATTSTTIPRPSQPASLAASRVSGGHARLVSQNPGRPSAQGAIRSVPVGSTSAASSKQVASAGKAHAAEPAPLTREEHAEVASQVDRLFAALLSKQGGRVTMRLNPEWLGDMTVRMELDRGAVRAVFETGNAAATSAVSGAIDSLRTALADRGLKVEELQVVSREQAGAAASSVAAAAVQVPPRAAQHVARSYRANADQEHWIVAEDPRHERTIGRARGSRGRTDAIDVVG